MARIMDKGDCFRAHMTGLSKAFDYILHDLLITKLHAYGVGMKSLRFLYNYLNGRKQRVKINNKYSLIIRKYNDNEILHKRTYRANEISRTSQN